MKLFQSAFLAVFIPFLLANKLCKSGIKTRIEGSVELDQRKGTLKHNGTIYKSDEYFQDGNKFYVCPCNKKPCIRLCTKELARKANLTQANQGTKIKIISNNKTISVNMRNYFNVLPESDCWSAYSMEQEDEDAYQILANGSINFVNAIDGYPSVFDLHSFCVLSDVKGSLHAFGCSVKEETEIDVPPSEEPLIEISTGAPTIASSTPPNNGENLTRKPIFFYWSKTELIYF